MNYKELDRKSILDYLASAGGPVSVAELIERSGAEKLRVYPLLFELQQAGVIRVVESEAYGAPFVVELA